MAISVTQRDLAMFHFIHVRRSALVSHVAVELYGQNPFDEEWNVDPEKACLRRLGALARAGYVRLSNDYDGRRRRKVVTLGPAAQSIVGERCHRRRVPARNRAHHIRTQEAVAQLGRSLAMQGRRILDVAFDQDVRGRDLKGRRTRAGEKFAAAPDAVCRAELRGRSGIARIEELAIEYVTSKYTDADIVAKRDSFRRFAGAHWFADNATTAARVQRLTGASCIVLT